MCKRPTKIARTVADNSFNSQSSVPVYTQQITQMWRKESTPTCFSYCIVFSHLQGVSLLEDLLSFYKELCHI